MARKQELLYAIVDIETTGGNASGSRITEIAIIIHDGHQIVGRFETLVNPEKDIPPAIFALTGITNEMVKGKPVFGDIAGQVFELLQGKIFVAHNVNFDYSFIKHQLSIEGYEWSAAKLCTVRMSRKIKPGLRSYSLGKLCDALQIPIGNRHRAGGDVDATVLLFEKLLQWDDAAVIPGMVKKNSGEQKLPPNLDKSDFDCLPHSPGVYYFINQYGKVIYVGKAVNIKKRVTSHFTGHNIHPQRQNFLRHIYSIAYENCATELMSLILECIEIKRLWPAYNRSLKRFEPKFGLIKYEDQNGYQRLLVGKLQKHQTCIEVFNREFDCINLLSGLVKQFQLDTRFCYFGKSELFMEVSRDQREWPDRYAHNQAVGHALEWLGNSRPTFALIDKGRTEDEKSCIWVERGNLYAMGYLSADTCYSNAADIKMALKRYYGNHYVLQLILSYAERYPAKVRYFEPHDVDTEYVQDLLMH